jgi:hypothetical protein
MICIVVGFLSLLLCLTSLDNTVYAFIFFIIYCISGIILLLSRHFAFGCGTIISLKYNKDRGFIINSNSYQFTNNPDYDASEIKKIVDDFEKCANELNIANKKCEEEQEKLKLDCCNKYKSVMQKVK